MEDLKRGYISEIALEVARGVGEQGVVLGDVLVRLDLERVPARLISGQLQ